MSIGNWASEASPTLGCSIEIFRDINIFITQACETDQSNWSVRVEYISIFNPNIPSMILGMVNGYIAMDTVVPSVEILCNKLNIQPFLVKYAGIYCTLGREYFTRPPASGNIPTLGTIYTDTDIPLGRVVINSVCRGPKCVGRITWAKHAHAESQLGPVYS